MHYFQLIAVLPCRQIRLQHPSLSLLAAYICRLLADLTKNLRGVTILVAWMLRVLIAEHCIGSPNASPTLQKRAQNSAHVAITVWCSSNPFTTLHTRCNSCF